MSSSSSPAAELTGGSLRRHSAWMHEGVGIVGPRLVGSPCTRGSGVQLGRERVVEFLVVAD